jgi:hypothetical protein
MEEVNIMADSSINIEEIMEEIRADIKARGYTDDILSFDNVPDDSAKTADFNSSDFSADIAYIRDQWNVMIATTEINNSKLKRLIKRIIRKMSFFLLFPITTQQSQFNLSVSKILIDITARMETCMKVVGDMKTEQALLKDKIERLTASLGDRK